METLVFFFQSKELALTYTNLWVTISPSLLKKGQSENSIKCRNFILQNAKKQILLSVATEVSFEWLHCRISSTDSEVGTTLQDSILNHSGIERVKTNNLRLPKNEKKEGLKN